MKTTLLVLLSLKKTTKKLFNKNVHMNSFLIKSHVLLKMDSVLNVVLNMLDLISCPLELNVLALVNPMSIKFSNLMMNLNPVKKINLMSNLNKKMLKKLPEMMSLKNLQPSMKLLLKKLLLKITPPMKLLLTKKSLKKLLLNQKKNHTKKI